MAVGRGLLGQLDVGYWQKELQNAKNQTAAANVIKSMMNEANWLGVSDNDQKAVYLLLQNFNDLYPNTSIKQSLDLWNPANNHINTFEFKNAFNTWSDESIDQLLNAATRAAENGNVNDKVKEVLNNGGTTRVYSPGQQAQITADQELAAKQEEEAKKALEASKNAGSEFDAKYNQLMNQNAQMQQTINKLVANQPRKIGADEAAELYNINVNYDDKLKEYNDKTNNYFDEAVGLEKLYRDQMQQDNYNYQDAQLRSYLNSYQNAAPTASRKGAVAATALLNMLGNSADLAQADSASGQSIINQEARRKAELANNPYLAQTDINSLRTYLSTLSTGLHSADVQKHAGEISSYATEYSGKRSGLAQAAIGAAYKYQGLAQAASTRAQNAALNSYDKMYNYYYSKYPELANSLVANKINAQYYPSANK